MVVGEYESFVARIRIAGDLTVITIPNNVVEFNGYKKGDLVKIMITKKEMNFTDGDEIKE